LGSKAADRRPKTAESAKEENMKALTVCQPYASLIVGWAEIDPEDVKRVENRTWSTSYRGPLLIHAGRSTKWLGTWDGPVPAKMPMGAILGRVDLVGCQSIESLRRAPNTSPIGWLKRHVHASGPHCLILRRPRRLLHPVPYLGMQGMFEVPDELLAGADWEPQCRVCGCTELDACHGGCSWAEDDLCSRCEMKRESDRRYREAVVEFPQ
jgi:hypothetical protein